MGHAAVEELRTRAERLQAIADNLPAIIAYWDHDERCHFSNRACVDWFKLAPESMLGRTLRDILGENLYGLNKLHI